MRFLKRRIIEPTYYDAQSTLPRRIATTSKRCGVCTFEVPIADITVEDGIERCPMCVDTYTAEWLADEEVYVANVKSESALKLVQPPRISLRALSETRPAAITSITDSAGNFISQSNPLRLVRLNASTLKLNGRYLSSSMTYTYPTLVTDNSAPTITSTLVTLSLVAGIGATPGKYDLTVADGVSTYGHTYPKILFIV